MKTAILIALLAAGTSASLGLLAASPALAKDMPANTAQSLDKADCLLNHGSWIKVKGWGWGCAYYK